MFEFYKIINFFKKLKFIAKLEPGEAKICT